MRRWNDSAVPSRAAAWLAALVVAVSGCGRRPEELPAKVLPESTAGQTAAVVTAGSAQDKPLEPFDPPPLASLNGDSTWIDRPVRDGLTMLR